MTTHEVLVKARGLIERPEDWCRGTLGKQEGPNCAAGALVRASGGDLLVDFAANCPGFWELDQAMDENIPDFNDFHSHAEVLAAFDKAIAATAAEPDTSFLNEVEVEEPVAS